MATYKGGEGEHRNRKTAALVPSGTFVVKRKATIRVVQKAGVQQGGSGWSKVRLVGSELSLTTPG